MIPCGREEVVTCLLTIARFCAENSELGYGYDASVAGWGCPMLQRWGLAPFQRTRPALKELMAEKVVVRWQGRAVELGERLHDEAVPRGLARA